MTSAAAQKDYKDTVNLPKTEFPMKGNLANLEPKMLAWWAERGIWGKLLEKNAKGRVRLPRRPPPRTATCTPATR